MNPAPGFEFHEGQNLIIFSVQLVYFTFSACFDVLVHGSIRYLCYYLLKDSKLDITIGPYETYEDGLFGYKVFTSAICL